MKFQSAGVKYFLWTGVFIYLVIMALPARYGLAAEMEFSIDNPAPVGPPLSTESGEVRAQAWRPEIELSAPAPQNTFEGINFDENADLTGFLIIPPDPIAAAGPDHIVSVVNSSVEWHTKTGVLQVSLSMEDQFFNVLSPQSRPFDPKIIYDQYAGRFVVIALELVDNGIFSPNNVSRILIGISDDQNPNGTWYFVAINAIVNIGGFNYWADYPGLAIDEEAVFLTANMFLFQLNQSGGSRLWILEKGDGTGGVYDGGTSTLTRHDPSAASGLGMDAFTLQPAHVLAPAGSPATPEPFLSAPAGLPGPPMPST